MLILGFKGLSWYLVFFLREGSVGDIVSLYPRLQSLSTMLGHLPISVIAKGNSWKKSHPTVHH